ncbi:MAG: molybdopterin-dependent oxidoreductase [Candidatus Eremiobacteraeota bacterium]|nr:molybdopterin-dependent oxidoreductase [Candidatus Eremiobacteraeota bacterium]
MTDDVTLTIDGTPVTVPAGTLLVEAAKTIDTDVPVYCYHPKLGPAGLCRICLVEIEKLPKLQIACNTPVAEGMVVHTYGHKVEDGRRAVMEFLLLNHPLDCPICDKGGECDLQDFSMAYGQGASRLADAKASKPKALDLGPTIVLDDERCIVCQRCSRFDDIITAERSLVVKDRGQRDVIATASGEPYRSNFSGNVTELCPVGALTSKTYRFKSRPWDNQRTETSCTQCSVGCRMFVDERYGAIARTMSVPSDDAISDGWLCDRGRYNIAFYDDSRRLTAPLLRRGDDYVQIDWDDAIQMWAKALRDAVAAGGPQTIGALGGGRLLNEEILLLVATMHGIGVTNLDWRTGRQRQASPGRYGGTYAELEAAQLIIAVGRPPSQTAPVLDLRIRKAVSQRGARYVTFGGHGAGSFVASSALGSLDELEPLTGDIQRIAVVWDGIDRELGGRLATAVDGWAARGVSVRTYLPGEANNARGAEALGLLPPPNAFHGGGILEAAAGGELRALSIFGANPMLHHPFGATRIRTALERVPFIVATELFPTATARLAHLILPARAGLEKSGHIYDLAGDVLAVNQAHAAPAGTLADGDMLVALAAELNVAVPAPSDLLIRATAPLPPATPAFGDAAYFDVPTRRLGDWGAAPNELRIAIGGDIFAGGGSVWFDETLAELRPQPHAVFTPTTAARHDVRAGDWVDLARGSETEGTNEPASGGGERALRDLVVRIDPSVREGFVAVVDGLPAAPANDFRDGEYVVLRDVRSASAAETAAVLA